MAEVTYALCTLTSFACMVLLAQGFRRTRNRLLLWTAACFAGFALNNVMLFLDQVVIPTVDLSLARVLPALAGVGVLLYGLIRETT
jgi:hypothetical protein